MKIINDEIIGELRYLTVEFCRTELVAGGAGVISQGAVRRYFEGKNPDFKVKKCGSLKLDSQRDIVTIRIGIVNQPPYAILVKGKTHPDNQPVVSDFHNREISQKLLNLGYDELKEQYDAVLLDYKNRSEETVELQKRYDALVIAVGKDAQKFSDLLVENENLKKEIKGLKILKDYKRPEYDMEIDYATGPVSESIPTTEEFSEAVQEVIKNAEDEGRETLGPDIGNKEIKDIAGAMSKPPLGLNIEGEYSGAHGSE